MRLRIVDCGLRIEYARGFTLIELLIVLAIIGVVLALASPRLSAFVERPDDRELRKFDQFLLESSKVTLSERKSDGPPGDRPFRFRGATLGMIRPEDKPLRVKIVPPNAVKLLIADTAVASFEFARYRIEDVEEEGRATDREPELAFTPMGSLPPFSLKLYPQQGEPVWWRLNRLGDVRLEPVR
ncbi:prepilin-type N-terminal cleavage/methylation domain-containing protein [bacterium]|nr:prepilin-type N-terminal cleavage/methylation domain-containing protein [bacterium]